MRRGVLRVFMSKNARLSKDIDAIELGFVEREATPKFVMKLGIQMHLAGLSLSNTVSRTLGVLDGSSDFV